MLRHKIIKKLLSEIKKNKPSHRVNFTLYNYFMFTLKINKGDAIINEKLIFIIIIVILCNLGAI